MNKTFKRLFTALLLLCTMTANAQNTQTTTFKSWTSTNKSQSSTSSTKYTFNTLNNDELSFAWSVSSESGYDWLIITLDNEEIVKKSGNDSGTYSKVFKASGAHELVVKYTKDGSGDHGNDRGSIYNITHTSHPAILSTGSQFSANGITYEVLSSSNRTVKVSGFRNSSDDKIGNVTIPPTITPTIIITTATILPQP